MLTDTVQITTEKGLSRVTLDGVMREGPLGDVRRAEIERKWQRGSPSQQKLTRSSHLKPTLSLQKAVLQRWRGGLRRRSCDFLQDSQD